MRYVLAYEISCLKDQPLTDRIAILEEQILNLLKFQFILIHIHRYSPHVCILLIFQMLFFLFKIDMLCF